MKSNREAQIQLQRQHIRFVTWILNKTRLKTSSPSPSPDPRTTILEVKTLVEDLRPIHESKDKDVDLVNVNRGDVARYRLQQSASTPSMRTSVSFRCRKGSLKRADGRNATTWSAPDRSSGMIMIIGCLLIFYPIEKFFLLEK